MPKTSSYYSNGLLVKKVRVFENFTILKSFSEPENEVGKSITNNIINIVEEAENYLRTFEFNWDGEESPGFDKNTIKRVTDFIYALSFLRPNGEEFAEQVKILPAGGGDINLHWETSKFELLVIFCADGSYSYYGDNKFEENSIQGGEKPDPEKIICWVEELNV